ncbi:hypothetical protein [Pedobacter sp. R20-19]|uniref:hypothetical protein n=1 Tax=Pedobacter sp. R20-19 TaxID=1270196 RepID=UPI0012FC89F0|nr:hypothetical protein [Pedobacter sp. R20-19]
MKILLLIRINGKCGLVSHFSLVSKERLLEFPYAVEIKELENEIIYIQLFDKIEESDKPENSNGCLESGLILMG